ncbi:MAG: PfkB family carbohydrate kinase [Candidatus Aminicenantales bacterium]
MSLIVVGSMAFDTIETPRERKERIVGGSCTYFSLAASFFTRPKVVSVVGKDFPHEVIELMEERGIDLSGLEIRRGKTFFWEGRYGDDPNQRETLKTELNVFKDFKPLLPSDYQKAGLLFLANIDPDLQEDILNQVKSPEIVGMDTIALWINTKKDSLMKIFNRIDFLFANDEEVRMLSGEKNLIRAGRALLEKGPSLVVLKKGEHGALLLGRDFTAAVLAHPCENVVDPTGAGDSFAGGFMGYLDRVRSYEEPDIRKAAVYGSVLASFTIEDFGITRLKNLNHKEIEGRFQEFRNLVSF